MKQELYELINKIRGKSFKRNYSKFSEINLYPGQQALLCTINENNGINQRRLAELTLKSPATITTMLQKMEKQELISIINVENNKRETKLELTEKGLDKLSKIKEVERNIINEMFNDFSNEELEEFYKLLCKMEKNIMEEKHD